MSSPGGPPSSSRPRAAISRAAARSPLRSAAARLTGWLELPADRRQAARDALSTLARERYGWEAVAESVIAAAQGRLDELPVPPG